MAQRLGTFARSATVTNATSAALAETLPGEAQAPADEIPFASALQWNALAFDTGAERGVSVLGAVEMLAPFLPPDAAASESPLLRQVATSSDAGLRVLLFAHNPDVATLHDVAGEPQLPALTPLALADELRPQAKETIAAFARLGMQLKIISGDNPHPHTLHITS